jgi:hypothetical protein
MKEKTQSQFGDDAKVKAAAFMVSDDSSSRETKQREEREAPFLLGSFDLDKRSLLQLRALFFY